MMKVLIDEKFRTKPETGINVAVWQWQQDWWDCRVWAETQFPTTITLHPADFYSMRAELHRAGAYYIADKPETVCGLKLILDPRCEINYLFLS